MALALAWITKADKDAYVPERTRWPSSWTLSQGNETLNALEKHAAALAEHGFSADDAQDLRDATHMPEEAGVTPDGARGDKKADRIGLVHAVHDAKAARKQARTVLVAALARMKRRFVPAVAAKASGDKGVIAAFALTDLYGKGGGGGGQKPGPTPPKPPAA